MVRRGRAFGLSTLVTLVCCVAMASAAQASSEFAAGSYPAAVEGKLSGLTIFRLGGSKEGKCEEALYREVLAESSSTLQVRPEYGNCTYGSWPVTMKPNGCTIGWNINEASGPETISCPAGEEFEVLVYNTNQLVCAYGIATQGAGGSISYSGSGSGSEAYLELSTNVRPTATVKTGNAFICHGNVGQSVSLNFSGGINAKAYNAESGKSVGLKTQAATLTGKFNTGSGLYPTAVNLSRTGSYSLLKVGPRTITCSEETLYGVLGAASKSISVGPKYAGCTAGSVLSVEVTTKGCTYNYSVQSSSGSTSTENLGLDCGTGELLIGVYNGGSKSCEYGLPSQTIKGVTGSDQGSGTSAYVELNLKELTVPTVNVKYSVHQVICGGKTGEVLSGTTAGILNAKASGFGLLVM